jgi:3-methyladenine DNA glycosylase AlkD
LRFIKDNQFDDILKIAEILLADDHNFIQKAVGWMLQEIGKRNIGAEEAFLEKHHQVMPLTMLRYATERFLENKRQKYMMKGPANIRT